MKLQQHHLLVLSLILWVGLSAPGWTAARLGDTFVVGLNLAWFDSDYGHDLGSSHPEGWKPSFTPEKCRKYFRDIAAMGARVVRVWAFERQEGLLFDGSDRLITGLDATFLQNCDQLMEIARENRLFVYWSLLNHLVVEDEHGKHMKIIEDAAVRDSYLQKAAVPFIQRYARHPSFWAVDLFNEAEGAIGGLDALSGAHNPLRGTSWKTMRTFLRENVKAVRAAVPGVKLTATSGWHEHKNLNRFADLGLDFLDWHSYQDAATIPSVADLGITGIPIFIGECGPQDKQRNDQLQKQNWETYLKAAYAKGYAGVLPWSYGKPGGEDNFSLTNANGSWRPAALALQAFVAQKPDLGPTFNDDHNASLLSGLRNAMDPVLATGPGTRADSAWGKLFAYLKTGFPYRNPDFGLRRFDECCNALFASARSILRKTTGAGPEAGEKGILPLRAMARKIVEGINKTPSPGREALLNRPSVLTHLLPVAFGRQSEILSGVSLKPPTAPEKPANPYEGVSGIGSIAPEAKSGAVNPFSE